MKTKLLLSNIIVVVMALAAAQTSNAQEGCVDPVNNGPCHSADSHQENVQCQVNCLCPFSGRNSQECWNSWIITIHTTDSINSNWGRTPGSTYQKVTGDPYDAGNCYWSVEQVTCPGLLPGDGCYPTLTYVTAGPGSRYIIHTPACI